MEEQVEQNVEENKIESLEDLHRIAEEGVATEEAAAEEVVNEPPAYEPNFAYTVRDEQKEFDERIRSAIKDKDTEDLVRDLYTRAEGLDAYKEKFSKRDSEYQDVYSQAQALTQGYQTLKEMRDKSDYIGLQKALGLNPDFVVDWGLKLLEEEELPPEQKEALIKQREMESRLAEQDARISQFEADTQNRRVEDDLNELKTLALSEKVLPVVQAMNEKGLDFAQQVVSLGSMEYQRTGKEPAVQDVVNRVAEQYKFLVPQTPAPEAAVPQVPQQQPTQQAAPQKPTLPSLSGANQATVDQPITSMDQLRKLADSI